MKTQIHGLFWSHSLISSSLSEANTCTYTHAHTNFVSRIFWNVAIFWALFFILKTFCSWLCLLVLSWGWCPDIQIHYHTEVFRGCFFFLPHWRVWGLRGKIIGRGPQQNGRNEDSWAGNIQAFGTIFHLMGKTMPWEVFFLAY